MAINSPCAMLITPISPNTIASPSAIKHEDGEHAQAGEGLHRDHVEDSC